MNIEEQDFYQKVGARVREIRTQKKLSQSELAVKASLSLPHISAIELGKDGCSKRCVTCREYDASGASLAASKRA